MDLEPIVDWIEVVMWAIAGAICMFKKSTQLGVGFALPDKLLAVLIGFGLVLSGCSLWLEYQP
ncbi:MAG TPA: hypothetical protein VNO43_00725 [Candidatus Eisenbacteria bacterium]|nr:hypothetical protein [Candidatus Eisenbacteria bacterium]